MTILEGFWKVEGLFCKAVGRPVEYTGSGQGEKEGQIQNSSPSMPKDLNVKRNHAEVPYEGTTCEKVFSD